jgi:hypothetical protein
MECTAALPLVPRAAGLEGEGPMVVPSTAPMLSLEWGMAMSTQLSMRPSSAARILRTATQV